MSKKIAILSAIMLVFGGVSLPGGFIINNVINDTVNDTVNDIVTDRTGDGLLGIEEQFVPIAEDIILEMGPAIALDLIREEAVPIIEQEIYKIGPAIALQIIKENAISAYQLRVNASFLTQFLYQAYEVGEDMSEVVLGIWYVDGGDTLLNLFFDYNELYLGLDWFGGLGWSSFSEQIAVNDLPPILGISQWWSREQGSSIDLEIGICNYVGVFVPQPDPNDLLAWGNPSQTNIDLEENDPPGFMQHREFGFGVLQFLEDYENAVATGDHDSFLNQYNQGKSLQWNDFVIVARYFYEYWVPEAMPILLAELQDPNSEFSHRAPEYVGMDLDDISYHNFLRQWIDFAIYSAGMDFHDLVEELPEGTHGLEVDSTISLESAYNLWDENNKWSFLNIEGIKKWYDANSTIAGAADRAELAAWFDISPQEVNDVLNWLWLPDGFSYGLFPQLAQTPEPYGYSTTVEDLSLPTFYELWANGTALGNFMTGTFPEEITGFEVGVPKATEMTINQIIPLWDRFNENSLTSITGIKKWHEANTNDAMKASLSSIFNLKSDQTQMILDWLWDGSDSFSQGLLPKLLESDLGYNMPLTDLARRVMLEQWANGTIMGMTMFEDGIDFHDFVSSLPEGSTGFEVGIPIPTGMSLESSQLLWDTSNPYSLVKDISVWTSIKSKDAENYAVVRDANKLDGGTMDMILEWLPEFIDNLMPALAQSEMVLPKDTSNLGNAIQIGGIIVGAIAIGLASIGIVSNAIVSKKRKSVIKGDKTVKKFDKVIGNLRSLSLELHEELDSESIPVKLQSNPSRHEIEIVKEIRNLRSSSPELHEELVSERIPINLQSNPPRDEIKFDKVRGNLKYLSKELQEDLDSKSIPIAPQSKPRDD